MHARYGFLGERHILEDERQEIVGESIARLCSKIHAPYGERRLAADVHHGP